jgi:hypothetical protein
MGCMFHFREGIDPPSSATTWEWTGEKLCSTAMAWSIHKVSPARLPIGVILEIDTASRARS